MDRNGNENGIIRPPDVLAQVRSMTEHRPIESDTEEHTWGVTGRGVADFLEIVDSVSGNPFVVAYGFQSDWAGEKRAPHIARLTFLCWGEMCWLTIIVDKAAAVMRLKYILMHLKHRTLKTLRADGKEVLSVTVELADWQYHPFAAQRKKFDAEMEKRKME